MEITNEEVLNLKDKPSKELLRKLEILEKGAEDTNKLISLNKTTTDDMDPDQVLASAYKQLQDVVIAGYDKEGNFYFASSVADGGTVMWLIEHLKASLMGIPTDILGSEDTE